MLLRDFPSLSIYDCCSPPVKRKHYVFPKHVVKIPEYCFSPNAIIPTLSLSQGSHLFPQNNISHLTTACGFTGKDKPYIRGSAISRPRAVISSPENDEIIGNINKMKTERPRAVKNQAQVQNRHANAQCKTYVDEHLMCDIEGNHLTAAAITGLDGAVWAKSATFPDAKSQEINGILKDFDEPGTLAPTGLHLGGAKYMVIQGEPGAVIRGKKGTGGVTIKKTGQALIFGVYDEPMTPGQCNLVVERLGDYLVDQGM